MGDEIALTAVVREYHIANPNETIRALGRHGWIWDHNPRIRERTHDNGKDQGFPLAPANQIGNLPQAYGRCAGIQLIDTTPELFLTEEEQTSIDIPENTVAIDMWAGWPSRRWGKFRELAKDLKAMGYVTVEVGSTVRDCYGNQRCERIDADIDLVDQWPSNPRFTAGVLRQCGLYIGNDSGLAHMAAAVGTPQIVIYGSVPWYSRAYQSTYPIQSVLRDCDDCAEVCRGRSDGAQCLDDIPVSQVIDTIERFGL